MNTALLKLAGIGIAAGLVAHLVLKTTVTVALIVGAVAAVIVGATVKATN